MYWGICTLCYFVRYKCISVTADYREVLNFFFITAFSVVGTGVFLEG